MRNHPWLGHSNDNKKSITHITECVCSECIMIRNLLSNQINCHIHRQFLRNHVHLMHLQHAKTNLTSKRQQTSKSMDPTDGISLQRIWTCADCMIFSNFHNKISPTKNRKCQLPFASSNSEPDVALMFLVLNQRLRIYSLGRHV